MALTDNRIKQANPKERPYKIYDERGLFLIVSPAGGKWWRFKYRLDNHEKTLSLGTYPDTSLKRAREKRDNARTLLADGTDPGLKRKSDKAARTAGNFEQLAREWLQNQSSKLKAETLHLTLRRFENWVFPYIGRRPVKSIEPPEILTLLRLIEITGKYETTKRVRQRIGQVFRYGIGIGEADRDPTADLRGVLHTKPPQNRAAITSPNEVGALLRAIYGYSGQPSTCAALKLLALTFVRPSELRLAEWPEIDLDNQIWRIPKGRMKMKREHIVPLSKQAVSIFRDLQPISGHKAFIFESLRPGRPISENTTNAALRTLGYSGKEMTSHGFRAMASTLLHELGWPPEVIELQLAHSQRNQVAAVYNRSARFKERTEMMQAWADYLDRLYSSI